ncbi:Homeodomain-like protein [Kalaharituber pfeilii]|nr:Homeodomain-like protein [Kalaharituber pfeilii]
MSRPPPTSSVIDRPFSQVHPLHPSPEYNQSARINPKRRRGNLPKQVTDTLRSWLNSHITHPYPTEEEKQQLCQMTGLTMNQISNWFINARRRRLPPRTDTEPPHAMTQSRMPSPQRPSTAALGHARSRSHDAAGILPPAAGMQGQQGGHGHGGYPPSGR